MYKWLNVYLVKYGQYYSKLITYLLFCVIQEELAFTTKEEQAGILQKVIAASDQDAEEERMIGEQIGGKAMVGSTKRLCPQFLFQGDFSAVFYL